MDPKVLFIVKKLRSSIEAKYPVRAMRVFGSSVRNERRRGSDIDVMVCLPELNRAIEEELFDIAYDLELENDCLIDLIAVDERDLKGKIGSAPIYGNILSEGVAV